MQIAKSRVHAARICDFIDGRIKRIPLRNSAAAAAATLVLLEADDVAQGVMIIMFWLSYVESAWIFQNPCLESSNVLSAQGRMHTNFSSTLQWRRSTL